jgi:hypothetical protein
MMTLPRHEWNLDASKQYTLTKKWSIAMAEELEETKFTFSDGTTVYMRKWLVRSQLRCPSEYKLTPLLADNCTSRKARVCTVCNFSESISSTLVQQVESRNKSQKGFRKDYPKGWIEMHSPSRPCLLAGCVGGPSRPGWRSKNWSRGIIMR